MAYYDQKTGKIVLRREKRPGKIPLPRAYSQLTNPQFSEKWPLSFASGNAELKGGLPSLIAMVRDLARSNNYIRGFGDLWVSDIVGNEGFRLQSLALNPAGRPDEDARKRIEEAWEIQGRPENWSVTRDMSRGEFKGLSERSAAFDGNTILVQIEQAPGDRFGYRLQHLEVDNIDLSYNEDRLSNGNRVVMGKELNEQGATVAYWMLGRHPGEGHYWVNGKEHTRIEAGRIIHRYYKTRPETVYGEPLVLSAISNLHNYELYEEAEQIASCLHASAAIAKERDVSAPYEGEAYLDEEISPGAILEGEPGVNYKLLNPAHPNSNISEFRKAVLMGVATGLPAQNYPTVGNDYGGVSYSSLRESRLVRKRVIKFYRKRNEEREERPSFERWLFNGLLKRDPLLKGLDFDNRRNLARANFYSQGFDTVDPWKEGKGLEVMFSLGLADPFEAAMEYTGKPLPEVVESLKKATKLFEDAGLDPPFTVADLSAAEEGALVGEDDG